MNRIPRWKFLKTKEINLEKKSHWIIETFFFCPFVWRKRRKFLIDFLMDLKLFSCLQNRCQYIRWLWFVEVVIFSWSNKSFLEIKAISFCGDGTTDTRILCFEQSTERCENIDVNFHLGLVERRVVGVAEPPFDQVELALG